MTTYKEEETVKGIQVTGN